MYLGRVALELAFEGGLRLSLFPFSLFVALPCYASDSSFGYIINEGFVRFQKKGDIWHQIMGFRMEMDNLF